MKICFLAHGVSIHTRQWTHFFRDRGHQVSLVTLTPGEPEPGIELHNLQHRWGITYERANWHYLFKVPRLWKVMRDIQPDILNAHFISSYGVLGALVRPTKCLLAIRVCGSDLFVFPKRSFLHSLVTRFALSRADLVISVAKHMTQALYDYITSDKPVLTQQYGIDTDRFFPLHKASDRTPVCLSNRAMVPICNLETVLLAARKLEAQGSPLHINLAGDGEQSDFLRRKAAELELHDRISFAGRIDHSRMPELLRSASIYISMCSSDGTSISLMEAMACGAFPVVSDIPANREWITDGVNGYLVSPDSPEQLAERLNEAWNHPELRQAAAKRNWSLIREKGNYRKNMSIIESAFMRLIEESREKR
jgi:glycosyltransferase involved in cell wall biosynthesis